MKSHSIFCWLLLGLLSGLCLGAASTRDEKSKQAIAAVLDAQVKAWNDGSIGNFMDGYAHTDTLRFASDGSVTYGWQATLERYQNKYSDRTRMGRLSFSDMAIAVLSADAATVFGRWRLERTGDTPSGLFTLIFRKTKEGWRIVHDHTSSAKP